jgi:predicted transcriptional regulator
MNSDVLAAMDKVDEPFVTATEIADQLDVTNKAVIHRLDELHGEGKVERKKVGANAVVWWRT